MNGPGRRALVIGTTVVLIAVPAFSSITCAQDHSQHQPAPDKSQAPPRASAPDQAAKESEPEPSSSGEAVDHAAMGHGHTAPTQPVDHAAMGHGAPAASGAPREPIPALTDPVRAAAFPRLREAHPAHDRRLHSFLLFDQLEAWDEENEAGLGWEVLGWAGGDIQRLWIRSEGEHFAGRTEAADLELLYGHAIARWWDGVLGIQQDFGAGPSQTFVGVGVIGIAPYKFEVEATAYVGESGQTRAVLEAEYELLLTNRLIAQPLLEITLHGEHDEERAIGAGLSTLEAGLRLRYEFSRRFAPYVGVVYERAFSQTADLRRAEGDATDDAIIVAGVRTWF